MRYHYVGVGPVTLIHADVRLDHVADTEGGVLCGAEALVWFETDPDMRGSLCRRCESRIRVGNTQSWSRRK